MSSHHIVRDNQEPALIIANGADCSDALLQQLMEWSPYVLALDGAVHRLLARKLRFDAWLGDFDSSEGLDLETMASMVLWKGYMRWIKTRPTCTRGLSF